MRRIVIGAVVAGSALFVGVGTAGAATPAVKGCVGASVSVAAKAFHPYGKNFTSTLTPRNDFGSFGQAVQVFQSGGIPDADYPNSCND